MLGQRSDPSRGPAFSLSWPINVDPSGIFVAQPRLRTPRTWPVRETADGSATVGGRVAKGRSSGGQGRSSPAIVPLPQELGDGDLDGARHRHGEQGAKDAGQFGTEQNGDDHYERR